MKLSLTALKDSFLASLDDDSPVFEEPIWVAQLRRVAMVAIAALMTAVVACWAVALLLGYRFHDVQTPSMGEAAPVGTIIITHPEPFDQAQVGDIVTVFPDGAQHTFTHRITEITSAGWRTKGDMNGAPDSWIVRSEHYRGTVVARLWGAGWVMRTGPPMVLGMLAVLGLTRVLLPWSYRAGARLMGLAFVFFAVTLWMQPWVRGLVMHQVPKPPQGMDASMVATGALPVTVTARVGGAFEHLRPGQLATVYSAGADEKGLHHYNVSSHLTGWWLVGAVIVIGAPLVFSLAVGWYRGFLISLYADRPPTRFTPTWAFAVMRERLPLRGAASRGLLDGALGGQEGQVETLYPIAPRMQAVRAPGEVPVLLSTGVPGLPVVGRLGAAVEPVGPELGAPEIADLPVTQATPPLPDAASMPLSSAGMSRAARH